MLFPVFSFLAVPVEEVLAVLALLCVPPDLAPAAVLALPKPLLPELVDDLPDESALMVVPSTGKITEMAFNSSSALPLITS